MIPSVATVLAYAGTVYQRGVVIDSQLDEEQAARIVSISKGSGD